jgi:hypothetical protein
MSFVRSKEIPPGSGHWYDYEVTTTREGSHVRQKVIRYIGRSATPHVPRSRRAGSKGEGL